LFLDIHLAQVKLELPPVEKPSTALLSAVEFKKFAVEALATRNETPEEPPVFLH